jgi:hypothetical protein
LDINTADVEEVDALPEVGPSTARASSTTGRTMESSGRSVS